MDAVPGLTEISTISKTGGVLWPLALKASHTIVNCFEENINWDAVTT